MRIIVNLALAASLLAITSANAQPPKVDPKLTPEQQEKLQARDKLWLDARRAETAGKVSDAIAAAAKAVAMERDLWGENDPRFVASLTTLADWHVRAEDSASARTVRKDVLAIVTGQYGKDDWRVTNATLSLADVGISEKLSPEDRAALRKANELNADGLQLANAGKWADARQPFQEGLATRTRLLGSDHRDTFTSQNNMGVLLRELKEYPEAIRILTDARDRTRKLVGETHPDYTRALTSLGTTHERVNELDKAEPLFREALATSKKLFGDAASATAQNDLARIHAKLGDAAKAEALFGPALDLLKSQGRFILAVPTARAIHVTTAKAKGASHTEALATAHRVGGLELVIGAIKSAEATLENALKAADANGEAKDELAARLANDLGVARYQLAKYKEAKVLFERALTIRQEKLGDKHADTLQSLRNLGWALEATGDTVAGRELLRKCYDKLLEAVKDPALVKVSSAEAVLLREPHPVYPRIRILYETSVPFVAVPPPPPADTEERAYTLDRLALLKDNLGLKGPYFGNEAAKVTAKLFGTADYRFFIARWNDGYGPPPGTPLPAPFGPQHPVAATVALAPAASGIHWERGVQPTVIPAAQAVGLIRRRVFGEEHPTVAAADEIVGLAKLATGDLEGALAVAEKVLAVRTAAHGERHPLVATSLNVLGVVHYHRGDLAKSRRLLERSHAIRLEKLGTDDVATAGVASDLAILARQQGDFATARVLLEQASATLLKLLGPDNYTARIAANNLRVVQLEMGDFAGPAQYYEGVLAGKGPAFEKTQARLNLAAIARTKGDLKEARRYYQEILDAKQADPSLFVDVPKLLNLLGATCRDMRDFEPAEKFLTDALALRRKTDTEALHPDTAFTLTSLGMLHHARGDYPAAEKAFAEALGIYRTRLGPTARQTADLAAKLGITRLMAGELPKAREALTEALRIKEVWARDQLPNLPEADALGFIAGLTELDPLLTALSHTQGVSNLDAYEAVWATKGIATRALVARRLAAEDTPEVRAASAALRQARANLAAVIRTRETPNAFSVPPAEGYDTLKHTQPPVKRINSDFEKLLVELTTEKERCERELIRVSATARQRHTESVATTAELAKVLPATAAVVDIVRVRRWTRKADGTFEPEPKHVYEAFVLKAEQGKLSVTRVDLGEADPIDQAVTAWRAMFGEAGKQPRGLRKVSPPEGTDPNTPSADRVLRERVWDKVAPAVGMATSVIVIPDGALTQLPFAALPGAKPGTFLLEEVGVVTATYGQQLIPLFSRPVPGKGKSVLVGGVNYAERSKDDTEAATHRPASEAQREAWKYLPGTEREVAGIAELKPAELVQLNGTSAGKVAVARAAGGARYVHIATHGFFADPKQTSLLERRGTWSASEGINVVEALTGRNPLVLSGLVLTGANAPDKRPGDGILTAEEIADLDLAGTELVVLSACETGLGTVAGGEGVFGLQRAFSLAGARATVGSLWQVDDDATAALMVEFYRRVWDSRTPTGKLEALRAAQLAVLKGEVFSPVGAKKGDRVSPYYWAAFVLSGDPR